MFPISPTPYTYTQGHDSFALFCYTYRLSFPRAWWEHWNLGTFAGVNGTRNKVGMWEMNDLQ